MGRFYIVVFFTGSTFQSVYTGCSRIGGYIFIVYIVGTGSKVYYYIVCIADNNFIVLHLQRSPAGIYLQVAQPFHYAIFYLYRKADGVIAYFCYSSMFMRAG